MSQARRRDPLLTSALRLVFVLAGICVGLLAVVVYLFSRAAPAADEASAALQDPEVRREVIARLVSESSGLYDSHVDADVGRVLLPDLKKEMSGRSVLVETNRFGIRERPYALPKPEGRVRIVILGDSMVYGFGVAAEERMGAVLERQIVERAPSLAGRVESIHLGIPSWNVRAQTSFLRRQLGELEPDVVFQIIVPNDIDDSAGTRGFGQQAQFSTQVRWRADGRTATDLQRRVMGFPSVGVLRFGLDHLSRARFEQMRGDIERLAGAVEAQGGRYRLLIHFRGQNPIGWHHIGRHLDPRHPVVIGSSFGSDRAYTIAADDPHWNPEGHEVVARLLYGLIEREDLLPEIELPAWPEAAETLERIAGQGRAQVAGDFDEEDWLARGRIPPIRSFLDLAELDAAGAAQIHAGIGRDGLVAPYAAFILRNPPGGVLRLEGHTLGRPELLGAEVAVFVDAVEVGRIEVGPEPDLRAVFALPPSLAQRRFLSVSLEASEYGYAGEDLQRCVVFELRRAEIGDA